MRGEKAWRSGIGEILTGVKSTNRTFACLAFDVSRGGGVAAENGHGNYEGED